MSSQRCPRVEGVRHAAVCWSLTDIFVEVQTADEKGLDELVLDRIQKFKSEFEIKVKKSRSSP